MLQHEKDQLLTLFETRNRWCKGSEARDATGEPVLYDDDCAVAWDLTGGLCHLFGWRRACQLFVQLDRHITGRKRGFGTEDDTVTAMSALLDFNDAADVSYERVLEVVQNMQVWSGAQIHSSGQPAQAVDRD
jgi:hypothetical protein